MIERLKNKIRSRKGASITFGLLIFVVCAVASSIIIVAASTSSGRLSGLKEMDERYYAVGEAVELLCETFDQRTATVKYGVSNGSIVKNKGALVVEKRSPDFDDATLKKIFDDATKTVLILERDEPYTVLQADEEGEAPMPITIPVPGADGQIYTCKLVETLKNGLLTFDISASGGKSSAGVYTLSVTFASNVRMSVVDASDTTVTESTATVSWTLRDIRKNPAKQAA